MSDVAGSQESTKDPIQNASKRAATPPLANSNATTNDKEMSAEAAKVETLADPAMPDAAGDVDAEADSEAETLIQSPEKQRTLPDNLSVTDSVNATRSKDDESNSAAGATDMDKKSRKRKRSIDEVPDDANSTGSSRRSSPLSSPRIPLLSPDSDSDVSSHIVSRRSKPDRPKRDGKKAGESDSGEERPTKTRKRRPSDIIPPTAKTRSRNNSGVDPGSTERRETRSATYPRHSSEDRSPSPRPTPRREHRRGVSTQLILGEFEKKKRGRPPILNTRRNRSADPTGSPSSEDDSDSAHNRPALHKFSSHDHDTMSPAKATGPRKWRDKNGRTFLSRACNNNDLETARARYKERPEDLNLADNAGNTPLQIAALEGFTNIVRFLLEQGCEVNTRNIDKETPLIDAVENSHVDVVRLLLEHGANPRIGNAKGDEPLELVPTDDDPEIAEDIKRMLRDAKDNPKRILKSKKSAEVTEVTREGTSSRAASAASPRDSPPAGPRSPPAIAASRRRTGRSESTRNDLLWQATTQEQLARSAAKGDVQGVANILNILGKAEPEALIAAAKAGHEEVLQYLLGMGFPDPDPDPVERGKPGYETPMLAAIGRGHPEVVKLLVDQQGFNPTRCYKGRTYYEIASDRKGDQWKAEHEILKNAYDNWSGRKFRKTNSPRATRDQDKSKSGARRRSQSPISSKLRNSSSPALTHKELPLKSPRREKEKIRDADVDDKRKPARKEASDSVAVSSDADQTVNAPRKTHAKRRSQSDLPPPSSVDSEGTHRRRRLMTGKDYRSQKNALPEESSDDDESAVAVKSEPKSGSVLKRTRASLSPEGAASDNGETGRSGAKKRRTVIESSPEDTRPGPRKRTAPISSPASEKKRSNADEETGDSKQSKNPKSTPIKVEEPMADQITVQTTTDRAMSVDVPAEIPSTIAEPPVDPQVNGDDTAEAGPSAAEIEQQRQEEARKAEEARLEQERLAAEKAAEEQRIAEEQERIRKAEEAERLRKAEEEAAARRKEEEERQERLKREAEERKRRQDEMIRQQRLEAERRRQEALPILLGRTAMMLDNNDPIVKSEEWLRRFLPLFTVKTHQLDSAVPATQQEELWVPNFQVAGLLATKDLNLRSYTSFDRREVTPWEKICLWKVSRNMLSYDYTTTGLNTPIALAKQREEEQRPKFYAMDELFWVKVSDFEDQVIRHGHLNGFKMRKQPISLRKVTSQSSDSSGERSPQRNGISPKLVNGITPGIIPHGSPTALYSNGFTR